MAAMHYCSLNPQVRGELQPNSSEDGAHQDGWDKWLGGGSCLHRESNLGPLTRTRKGEHVQTPREWTAP